MRKASAAVESKKQIAPDIFNIGDKIRLLVGFNPKRNAPGFIPQFVYRDNFAQFTRSMRIFIPSNTVKVKQGEIWDAEVKNVNVSEGIAGSGGRKLVYINVKVLSRHKVRECEPDYPRMKFFVRTKSGTVVLDEKSVAIERLEPKTYQHRGDVVRARLYLAAGKVIKVGFDKYLPKEVYISELADAIGRSANPNSLLKMIDKLPVMPEVINFRNIEI